MNYITNDDYECLQITVDENLCIIGSMDLISSAFVNFIVEMKNESLYDYKALVELFDSTTVKYGSYINGHFRTPEIMVQSEICPNAIKIVRPSEIPCKYPQNREIYNENLKQKLFSLVSPEMRFLDVNSTAKYLEENEIIKKMAVHDDSFGMLHSYMVNDTNEFFTIETTCSK